MPETRKISDDDMKFVQKSYRLSQSDINKINFVREKFGFTTETDALKFIINAFSLNTDPTGLTKEQIQRVVDYVLPSIIEQLRTKFTQPEEMQEE